MKKTFTRSDGSTETIEGTPEEIAAYERSLRTELDEKKNPVPARRLLTEEQMKLLQDFADRVLNDMKSKPVITPVYPVTPPYYPYVGDVPPMTWPTDKLWWSTTIATTSEGKD